jgi:hypothetical protein
MMRSGLWFDGMRLVLTRPSQYGDLVDPQMTRDELVGMLMALLGRTQSAIYVTAVRSDHHDDSGLSPGPLHVGTHAYGWAIDCWPMSGPGGEFYDGSSPVFAQWLSVVAKVPNILQVGLAGSADTSANREVLGGLYFSDTGADHVHIGVRPGG